MTHEAALACAERMRTDQAFRDQVAGAGDDAARLQVINDAGFAVTAEDRDTVVAALAPADGELSDEQLEGVSGAGAYDPCYPPGFPMPGGGINIPT
jgi:predicted ribosomally synthesized peptide with nif11-like leader